MLKADYQEIINLRTQISELEDAGKSKDAALKRALQKLEHTTDDLDKATEEIDAKEKVGKNK